MVEFRLENVIPKHPLKERKDISQGEFLLPSIY